jgi:hypothetical protein
MKIINIVLDVLTCFFTVTTLLYFNFVVSPSKWLWLDILTAIAIVWVLVEVFYKSYLYDQLEDNK